MKRKQIVSPQEGGVYIYLLRHDTHIFHILLKSLHILKDHEILRGLKNSYCIKVIHEFRVGRIPEECTQLHTHDSFKVRGTV